MPENDDDKELRLKYQQYFESLPAEKRELVELQLKHSVTFCTLDGKFWFPPKARENLFEVVSKQRRFLVDTNSNWNGTAAKPEHKDKAFIIGKTVIDEGHSMKRVLFRKEISFENNNLFILTRASMDLKGEPLISLERLDPYYRSGFDERELEQESCSLEYHANMKKFIEHERDVTLLLLGKIQNIEQLALMPREDLESLRARLLDSITQQAPLCLHQYTKSADVARCCYALLLIDWRFKRTEFSRLPFNIFNDTRVIQNALFLQSEIISDDNAVNKMARDAGLACHRNL